MSPSREIFLAVQDSDSQRITFILSQARRQRRRIINFTHALNEYGQTPLDLALSGDCRGGVCRVVVDTLLQWGAWVSVDNVVSAAQRDSNEILQALLLRGGRNIINRTDTTGWNPLQFALSKDLYPLQQLSTVDNLLDNGAMLNMYSPLPALHIAVKFNQDNTVICKLLQRGGDPNLLGENEETVLHAALRARTNYFTIRAFLSNGADVSITDFEGYSILHVAIQMKYERYIVNWLLDHAGVDCHAQTRNRKTALHFYALVGEKATPFSTKMAAINGDRDRSILTALIEAGANVDALDLEGATPLYYAAFSGHEDIVRELLEAGADPNLSNGDSKFPLQGALRNYHKEIFELMIAEGANPEVRNFDDESLLHLSANMIHGVDFVNVLIENNCNVDLLDGSGATALHHAARCGHTATVRSLLEANANANIQDENGRTPLHLALINNADHDIIYLLICRDPTPFDFHRLDLSEPTIVMELLSLT